MKKTIFTLGEVFDVIEQRQDPMIWLRLWAWDIESACLNSFEGVQSTHLVENFNSYLTIAQTAFISRNMKEIRNIKIKLIII